MTGEKVQQVLAHYQDLILSDEALVHEKAVDGILVKRFPEGDYFEPYRDLNYRPVLRHLAWMCEEASKFVLEGRVEKAMRWLGFIQGWLWTQGLKSLDDLKNDSKPDEVQET